MEGVARLLAPGGKLLGPQASHEAWSKNRLAHGWVYGEKKDLDAKTHPCLVPFDQLPVDQQAKDFLFVALTRTIHAEFFEDAYKEPESEDDQEEGPVPIDPRAGQQPQTPSLGRGRVGVDFNPSGLAHVDKVKMAAADLIDLIKGSRVFSADASRCQALAMTHIENGAMWAVKAMTKDLTVPTGPKIPAGVPRSVEDRGEPFTRDMT
jgi:hypothetical protein